MNQTEFERFYEVGQILNFYNDLWTMVTEWEDNKKQWEAQNIFDFKVNQIEDQLQ
jgi:hypothetical protein